MNYPNRGYGNRGGGFRGPRPGGRGQVQGQNRPGKYEPGKAWLRPNMDKVRESQPDFKGVITVDAPGVYFISGWDNEYPDGGRAIRIQLTAADSVQNGQGRPYNGGYQQQGGYPQRGQYQRPQNGYQAPYGDGPQEPRQHRQNGAMSRARPIPPQYDEHAPPPHTEYPEQAEAFQEDEAPY